MTATPTRRWIWIAWLALGGVLAALAVALLSVSHLYDAGRELIDMPSLPLAAALVVAGAVFLLTLPLIRASLAEGLGDSRPLLWIVIAFGLAFRLILFASTPAFEDDWYRYLWDGAVSAHGYNPYAVSPDDAQGEPYYYSLQPLAQQSGVVIERVNHSHLKTIYPPVAQAAFALAHLIDPWSLLAWRGVLLAADCAALSLLLALLRGAGRSPLWAALYWWNPVVVKEIANSAHMEGIVTPFVLAAVLLTLQRRPIWATGVLGLAMGAKLWPVMLAPLVLRPLLAHPRRLVMAMALLAAMAGLWALPVWLGGVDQTSGFVAFAHHWRTNSAHFPLLERAMSTLLSGADLAGTTPGVIVRGLLAGAVAGFAVWQARRPIAGAQDLMTRAGLVTGVLYLLSPAQFPWYAIWMIPFLCIRPWLGLLAVTALVPVYYSAFHFIARDTHEVYRTYAVWAIWVPVWTLLAWEAWRTWWSRDPADRQPAARETHA